MEPEANERFSLLTRHKNAYQFVYTAILSVEQGQQNRVEGDEEQDMRGE